MVHRMIDAFLCEPIHAHDPFAMDILAIRGSQHIGKAGTIDVTMDELDRDL